MIYLGEPDYSNFKKPHFVRNWCSYPIAETKGFSMLQTVYVHFFLGPQIILPEEGHLQLGYRIRMLQIVWAVTNLLHLSNEDIIAEHVAKCFVDVVQVILCHCLNLD